MAENIKILKHGRLDWHLLQPWQPEGLKKTTPRLLQKLKNSVSVNGAGVFLIWERKGKYLIIDGHHRHMALKSLEAEGQCAISEVDCIWLAIDNEDQAKEALLVANSHYSQFEKPGYRDFIKDMDIGVIELKFQPFKIGFDYTENAKVISQNTKKCPHCGKPIRTGKLKTTRN